MGMSRQRSTLREDTTGRSHAEGVRPTRPPSCSRHAWRGRGGAAEAAAAAAGEEEEEGERACGAPWLGSLGGELEAGGVWGLPEGRRERTPLRALSPRPLDPGPARTCALWRVRSGVDAFMTASTSTVAVRCS